jgi:hypothetical protein
MWCDDNGWGPVADGNGSRALTLCFCATAVRFLARSGGSGGSANARGNGPLRADHGACRSPRRLLLMTKPYVNPPKSPTFVLKLMLSAAALLCGACARRYALAG